jgi:lysophospholipase L1-like esterase
MLLAMDRDIQAYSDHWMYRPHPFLGFSPTPTFRLDHPSLKVSVNSLGFRGADISTRKADNTVRIFCLGGSSTWGFHLNEGQTWPDRLRDQLGASFPNRVEVINAGVPGYTTFQSLINFQTSILDHDPDIVIVYHVWNDLKYWPELSPDRNFSDTFLAKDLHEPGTWTRLFHSFHSLVLARAAMRKLNGSSGEPSPQVRPARRNLSYGRDIYRRNLLNLLATAKANGVRVMLANELTLIRPDTTSAEDRSIMWFLPKPAMIRALDEADQVLRELAAGSSDSDVTFVDVRRQVPANLENLMDHIHPTATGCTLLGASFARALMDWGMAPVDWSSGGRPQASDDTPCSEGSGWERTESSNVVGRTTRRPKDESTESTNVHVVLAGSESH